MNSRLPVRYPAIGKTEICSIVLC
uniref:Uncharacterized protein n=1 Tax=Arundo donax TaxID=35708 RepID=A0A0A9AZD7_ARUDO